MANPMVFWVRPSIAFIYFLRPRRRRRTEAASFVLSIGLLSYKVRVVSPQSPDSWIRRCDLVGGFSRIIDAPSPNYANQIILLTGAETPSLTKAGGRIVNETGKKLLLVRGQSADESNQIMAFFGVT